MSASISDAELRRLGFSVLQPVVYHARPIEELSEGTVERLRRGEIDGVLLLSPRTAATFAQLLRRHGLFDAARRLTCFCISRATADQLADVPAFAIEIAEAPNLQEVLALTLRVRQPSAQPSGTDDAGSAVPR